MNLSEFAEKVVSQVFCTSNMQQFRLYDMFIIGYEEALLP
jgi:hypothetical protein